MCEGQRKECGKKRIRRNAGRQCEGMREGCAKESVKEVQRKVGMKCEG